VRPPGAVSPTGETIYGVEIPLIATLRVPNAVALAYTARAVLILVGGSSCALITFLLVDQSLPSFLV